MSVPRSGESYPLSSLFLLVAAAGILMSVYAPLLRGQNADLNPGTLVLVALIGFFGALLGMVIGAHHYRRRAGALLGTLIGGTTMAVASPLMFNPKVSPTSLLPTTLVGCALLIGLGFAIRFTHSRGNGPAN